MADRENAVILKTDVTFSPCIVPLFLYHTALSFNDLKKAFQNIVEKRRNAVVLYMYESKI